MIIISFKGISGFIRIKLTKLRKFKGSIFGNLVEKYIFLSDTKYYVPLELILIAENVHLFSLHGQIMAENLIFR